MFDHRDLGRRDGTRASELQAFRAATARYPAPGIDTTDSSRLRSHDRPWCLSYEPDTVQITGTLQRLMFPGPPNYESVAGGDAPETGFYLLLTKPVCTNGDSASDDTYPLQEADTVQLVLDSAGYACLRPFLGQQRTLSGTLFARSTGHHHAPLLLRMIGAR